MLLPVCDGSKPLPVAPKTDQELLSVAFEQILLPMVPETEPEQELSPTTSEQMTLPTAPGMDQELSPVAFE